MKILPIATYVLAGELALGKVLAGELPRPAFPPRLRETAPGLFRLAAGALSFADATPGGRTVACLANLCQAVLATAQGGWRPRASGAQREEADRTGRVAPSRTGSRNPGRTWARSSPTSAPASG